MEKSISPFNAGKKGFFIASLLLISIFSFSILTKWFDFVTGSEKAYLTVLVLCSLSVIGSISWALLYYRKNNEGLLTFGEGLSIGMIMGTFTTVVVALCIFLLLSYMMVEPSVPSEDLSIEEDPVRLPVLLAFSTGMFTFFGFLGASFLCSLILRRD